MHAFIRQLDIVGNPCPLLGSVLLHPHSRRTVSFGRGEGALFTGGAKKRSWRVMLVSLIVANAHPINLGSFKLN